MEEYTVERIHACLRTFLLGKHIELYQQVGSTNDLTREAGRAGGPEGLVLLAEEQARGRGRLGRTWAAPPSSSILCSVLLRPQFSPQQAFYLTVAASLAILRAIGKLSIGGEQWTVDGGRPAEPDHVAGSTYHNQTAIKWPNDVLVNGRKVAGVLCESEFKGGSWAFAIVGFGINVNLPREKFGGLQARATSLSAELGYEVDRAALLANVLQELEACYLSLQNGQMRPVFQPWRDALETLGKEVTVDEPGGQVTGTAIRVDPDGALVVKSAMGTERRIVAGDVT